MKIDGRDIGKDHPPYIIAEMSANHNRDINRAFKIIDEAKKAGATEEELAETVFIATALRAGAALTHGTHLL